MDDVANREMLEAGVCIALMICGATWQVMRTLSRGGMGARGLIQLTCNLILLGIALYVGYSALNMWT
jgi:hypothetical protein